jgi:signal transduction histidine kinase
MRADAARIVSASERMRERLDDLLSLARAGRIANPTERISLTVIAEEARALCEGGLSATGVTVTIQPGMPEALVDRIRFVEVFQNLIENAIKFTRGVTNPAIAIGMRQDGPERTIFVKDNGIGIAPRFHETVFGLFDKLDPGAREAASAWRWSAESWRCTAAASGSSRMALARARRSVSLCPETAKPRRTIIVRDPCGAM